MNAESQPVPVVMLSRLAAAAAARHPDSPELRELAAALTLRELSDARAAQTARQEFVAASRRLDRKIIQTPWLAGGMLTLVAANFLGHLAGWW